LSSGEKCSAVKVHDCYRIEELSKKRNTMRAIYKRMTLREGDSILRSEDNLKSVAVRVYTLLLPVCRLCVRSIVRSIVIPLSHYEAIPHYESADCPSHRSPDSHYIRPPPPKK
jgi:hypothetical protein